MLTDTGPQTVFTTARPPRLTAVLSTRRSEVRTRFPPHRFLLLFILKGLTFRPRQHQSQRVFTAKLNVQLVYRVKENRLAAVPDEVMFPIFISHFSHTAPPPRESVTYMAGGRQGGTGRCRPLSANKKLANQKDSWVHTA
ncbi:hypothetical protein SKAU_G00242070 [Synaphobranchus kaupii]|uniref:Uncharacterized protein n=1 Tax=Synaphobranchus kaupii TaxID=118154 RepID=A0A9Q1F871_SYNKA|nr:hypothetical protein SKAU_G00242070 [Synaphobranchus kaupii]